jgi:phosphate transport system substrate-binding protein
MRPVWFADSAFQGDLTMNTNWLRGAFVTGLAVLMSTFVAAGARGDTESAATVTLHGATSEARTIKTKQADIETKAGTTLTIVANSSGRGLTALLAGKCDIAMVAGTLELNAINLNAKTPGSVDTSKLREFNVFEDTLSPVCNPANGVTSLSMDQVKDILTGKIKNWKEVGGADLAIMVVIPQPTDGGYMTVKAKILDGDAYTADARSVQSAPDQNKIVGQVPGGFAVLSKANQNHELVKVLDCDKKVGVVNSLVTIGDPNPQLMKVISTIQDEFKDLK